MKKNITTSKISIYEYAINYINTYFTKEPSNKEKKIIINVITEILNAGWTTTELDLEIEKLYNSKPGLQKDKIYLSLAISNSKYTVRNLIENPEDYYHNELRITSSRPTLDFDPETGKINKNKEIFFSEQRASYTVYDLHDYLLSKTEMFIMSLYDEKQFIGSLNWLIQRIDIDIILFIIDSAYSNITKNPSIGKITSPLELKKFIENGKKNLSTKKNELINKGINEYFPLKRKLRFGGEDNVNN